MSDFRIECIPANLLTSLLESRKFEEIAISLQDIVFHFNKSISCKLHLKPQKTTRKSLANLENSEVVQHRDFNFESNFEIVLKNETVASLQLQSDFEIDHSKLPFLNSTFFTLLAVIVDRCRFIVAESRPTIKRQKVLQNEKRMVRRMVRAAPVPMAMFDRNFRILAKSRLWSQSSGIQESIHANWNEHLSNTKFGKLISTSIQVRNKQGELSHFNTVMGPWCDKPGIIEGLIVVSSSVNEFVEARERALLQSRMKSAFLANMSHEIRTPMNGVLGMLEMLKTTPLSAEQADYIDTIFNSAESLLTILNDILDFSKIEAGKFDLSRVWFNLHDNLRTTVKTFESVAKKKGIELKFIFDAEKDLDVFSDPVRVRQVVNNFVSNAIKFTHEGAVRVHVKTNPIISPGTLGFKIEVTDSGIGMTGGQIKELFKPFEQADSSTSRQFGGTGLGLAISKSLVEMLNGKIQVESQVNVGSAFSVEFNFDSRMQTQPHRPIMRITENKNMNLHSLRVLVAEDNLVNQQVIELMLKGLSIQFKIVGNGMEAINEAKNNPYDVVFLDCQMPIMDGYTAASELRGMQLSGQLPSFPIVALTAHALDSEKNKCFASGMTDFLTKPLTIKTLKNFLQEIVLKQKETTVKLIDAEQIEQLKLIAGDDAEVAKQFFGQLISSFESSVPPKVGELRTHFSNNSLDELKKSAHYLKSTFGNLGMTKMQLLVMEIEKLCQDRTMLGLEERITCVESEYQLHLEELRTLTLNKAA